MSTHPLQQITSRACDNGQHVSCIRRAKDAHGAEHPCACRCHTLEPHHLTEAIAAYGGSHSLKVALIEVLAVHRRIIWEPTGRYCCAACATSHVRYPCRTVIAMAQGLNIL